MGRAVRLHEEFAVSAAETTVGRAPKQMGYVKLSARPHHHARIGFAMDAFKKTSQANSRRWARRSRRARP